MVLLNLMANNTTSTHMLSEHSSFETHPPATLCALLGKKHSVDLSFAGGICRWVVAVRTTWGR